jgi:tetratricopeptide (TPR) repeat protein
VLKRRATLAFDSREQASHYLRIGALYEGNLGDLTEATEAYRMVIRLDDTDAGALEALERIYAAQSQWRELIEILELRAAVTYDPAPLSALRFRIAGLWHRQLANNERAIEAYKDVLGIKPDDMPSLIALEQLYGSLEKWDRYLDVLDQRLNLTSDTAERKAILFRTADVYETRFDDIDRAVDALNMVMSADPADLQAIETLERLYSDNQRFQELVDTYERHVSVVTDVETKAAVLASMGRTIVEELQDIYRGVATYSRILEFAPDNFVALERLGQLYEELGDARKAIEMYERLADIAPVLSRRAELLHRAGELYEGELGDSDTAEQRYRTVLTMDETFLPSMQALQRVYMTRESWLDAIEMIEAQIEYTRDLAQRSLLLVAIGQLNEDHMGNAPAAQRRYEEALELDPGNVLAAEPLSRMYFDDKKWERAKSCLDLLVASDAYEKDDPTLSRLYTQLGRVNEELTFDDEAQRLYERTRRLQTGSPEALLGLARILRRLGRLQDAYSLNMEVVNDYASTLSSADYAGLLFQCAEIMAELGQADESQSLFEKVLEIDPRHMLSLKRLVAVVETTGDPRRIAEAKYRLQAVTEDPLARLALLTQVGDAWVAAGELHSAERAYREAVRIDPGSKAVLTKLLKVYLTDEKWEPACEVLGLLANSEPDATRKAYYMFTIGTLFRDQLSSPSKALEFFNAALDSDPFYGDGQAFEAIDKLVTEARDWNTQEREYRRMLARIAKLDTPKAETMKFVLAQALGEIYRSRIGDLDKAIDAFRLALGMQPDNESLMSSLAELYERQGIDGPELITLHQQILAVKPLKVDSYHTLYNAYRRNKDFDKAWCVSSVLTFVQRQTPEEDQYFKRYYTPQVPRAKRGISDDLWNLLVHPDADPMISGIFGIIAPALREEYSNDLKRWNINKRRDKLELSQPMPLTTMLTYVFERLGVSPMAVYTTSAFDGLFNGNMEPPSLVAGGNLLQGRSERELAFICSKMVTTCRPEYYLGSAFNATEALKIFFYAALALQTGQVVGDAPVDTVREYVNALARLPEPRLAQLRKLVSAFINSGRNPDLSAWLRGVDHTANRVGLLLSGDVQVAADWTKNDMLAIGKEQPAERVRQLLKFSVSEDYFALRRELGLALTA